MTQMFPGARIFLRLEGLALLLAAIAFYARMSDSWSLFAWLVLLPDLALLAYLAGPRVGAFAYNATHSTLGPLLMSCVAAWWLESLALALIWLAHIGADRALGFGLKSPDGFGITHLGSVGRGS